MPVYDAVRMQVFKEWGMRGLGQHNMKKYKVIIALEGIDGAGKTTLINLLKDEYKENICVYSRKDS